MLNYYNQLIWWTACRVIRQRYKLSVNCVQVIVSCYTYNIIVSKPFNLTDLVRFAKYFSHNRIKVYLTVLISKGFVLQEGQRHNKDTYIISDKGKQVIKELNDSYEIELIKFCSKYNIEL
jgi:predicted transcriptional regulator